MTSGIALSEILIVLALIVILVKPKDIPEILRKIIKFAHQLRAEFKKLTDELGKI